MLPDLRKSDPAIYDALDAIVLQGARSPLGMPRFDAFLNQDDVDRAARVPARARRAARRRVTALRIRKSACASDLALLSIALALTACGEPPPPAPASDPITKRAIASGEVVGFVGAHGSHVWLGIPYAAPPTGALRWRAPRDPRPWQGAREALAFGARCPQYASQLEATPRARHGVRQRGLPHAERVGAAERASASGCR